MKRKMFALYMAAVLLLAGCGGGNSMSSAAGGAAGGDSLPASSAPSANETEMDWTEGNYWDMPSGEPMAPGEQGDGEFQSDSVYQNAGAKLIRQAELSIQTERFDESEAALKRLVAGCGGYFEVASVYGGGRRDAYANRSGEYTVRVPAEKYSQFFNSAGDLGYITSSTERSEDVGERYYDTEARLKTQRTKQERLLALLERAESMEDIISLENALSDAEYQIEQYTSELNRYDALIGFSTFNIYLNEVSTVMQEVGETASLGARIAAGFQSSLRGLARGSQNLVIWVSYNIFLVILLAAMAAVAVFAGRRQWKKVQQRTEDGDKKEN